MAIVFTKTTDWIQHGNTRVKFIITADDSGSTVTWKAKPSSAQTLCYKYKYSVDANGNARYYYLPYGENNPVTFALKIGTGAATASKVAVGSVNTSTHMSGSGWQGWSTTTNEVTTTSSGDYTDVTVYLVTSGTGGSKITTISSAGSSPSPTPTPSADLLGYTKVGGSWKQLI